MSCDSADRRGPISDPAHIPACSAGSQIRAPNLHDHATPCAPSPTPPRRIQSSSTSRSRDPERDVDRYFASVARRKLRPVAAVDTHIHTDYLSGTPRARRLRPHRVCCQAGLAQPGRLWDAGVSSRRHTRGRASASRQTGATGWEGRHGPAAVAGVVLCIYCAAAQGVSLPRSTPRGLRPAARRAAAFRGRTIGFSCMALRPLQPQSSTKHNASAPAASTCRPE